MHGQPARSGPARFGSLRYTGDRLEEALRLDPTLTEARVRLGRVMVERGYPDAAIAHLERARREAPDGFLRYLAALFLGAAHAQKRAWEQAAECYRAALRQYPEAQAAYVGLGHALQAAGRPDEAGGRCVAVFLETTAEPHRPERDPWWVYFDAQTWQTGHRIEQMRA